MRDWYYKNHYAYVWTCHNENHYYEWLNLLTKIFKKYILGIALAYFVKNTFQNITFYWFFLRISYIYTIFKPSFSLWLTRIHHTTPQFLTSVFIIQQEQIILPIYSRIVWYRCYVYGQVCHWHFSALWIIVICVCLCVCISYMCMYVCIYVCVCVCACVYFKSLWNSQFPYDSLKHL